MDELIIQALKEGGSVALAIIIFMFYRKDAKEARETIAELKSQMAQADGLNREALIDSTRTQQQLVSVVENDMKVSERVLEKLDGK